MAFGFIIPCREDLDLTQAYEEPFELSVMSSFQFRPFMTARSHILLGPVKGKTHSTRNRAVNIHLVLCYPE